MRENRRGFEDQELETDPASRGFIFHITIVCEVSGPK